MAERPDETGPTRDPQSAPAGEFFSVGVPLQGVQPSYIRRRADDLLFEAALAGRYAHVIAPDRSGKSSLVAATAARLEAEGVRVAVLDLNQVATRDGGTDTGRWYYNVAYRLLRQLRIRFELQEWWQDKAILGNRQRLLDFYSEVLLANVPAPLVVFVDEMQSVEDLGHADQFLASIRSAYNVRATDPEFARLTFVLLGESDPLVLVNEPDASPFNVTQAITLDDFSRTDLGRFRAEFPLAAGEAEEALDRIWFWTRGQPYLTQKLARAVARSITPGDVPAQVDRIAWQQLASRAALNSEPHMSHIHRQVVNSGKLREGLLNLYGRIRKGITVSADLGSPLHRRLLATGLVEVDETGDLKVRNRAYETVFTARWANENIRIQWRVPLVAAAVLLLVILTPLWYTQWLPNGYARTLTSPATTLTDAESAWRTLRGFPGHAESSDRLFRAYLSDAALRAESSGVMAAVAALAAELPDAGSLPQELTAAFWDRRSNTAMRGERRDEALLAAIEALIASTSGRRDRAAMLVGDDYPLLRATVPPGEYEAFAFDPGSRVLSAFAGPAVTQWSLEPGALVQRDDWTVTALDVTPVVRRVIVDQPGTVERIGVMLNISHPRFTDLRMRLIAPSGRAVEIQIDRDRASNADDLRAPPEQLVPLVGESLDGTWSLSLRDEATGVAGHLAGWTLTLNAQGLVESFERGMSIPDPVERETGEYLLSPEGRYAVARASQSDSARVWDLVVAKPLASLAVGANESLLGVGAGANLLLTATLESVNVWDTSTGRRAGTLTTGTGSPGARLTADGRHLFVERRGDAETRFELWDVTRGTPVAEFAVAGQAALVAINADASRIAVADYDRAVRIWDFRAGTLLAQLDLPLQPTGLELNAGGQVLGAVFGRSGLAAWQLEPDLQVLVEQFGTGRWQLAFSPSGARLAAGRPGSGFQVFDVETGRLLGPAVGLSNSEAVRDGYLLKFGDDEASLVTSGMRGGVRFWQIPRGRQQAPVAPAEHAAWSPAGDAVVAALPDATALAIADRSGHVHFSGLTDDARAAPAEGEDLSFLGHSRAVRMLIASSDGELLASVGADHTVRVWNSDDGLPRRYIASFPGSPIGAVAFSPDNARLGLLAGHRLVIISVADGSTIAELDLHERLTSLAFANDETLYIGGEGGSLVAVSPGTLGRWDPQIVWQGDAAVRQLEASPNGRWLVLVDDANRARVLDLVQGAPGGTALELPSPVEDVVFSPNGSRVLFRTARWVHRASASVGGLTWLDAAFIPKPLRGAGIVFGDAGEPDAAAGDLFYLPVARDGAAHLLRFGFADNPGLGLVGNADELANYWEGRLGRTAGAVAGGAPAGSP
ncbi:MAG TPA: AAA-like domain-containing protein [Woeseiaceae bacterium]|nr:AAA-like domain-containing protein [Woeseiaceae bacterium]